MIIQNSFFDGNQPFKIIKPIRLIELFAGIGAQAKALTNIGADFEHYRMCEIDKYAVQSYNAVHGTNFKTSDITKITGEDLSITDTDKFCYILTYSFPCTDLSQAGQMKGMKKGSGTRSGLLWQVERLLDEIVNAGGKLPQVLIMENVKNLVSKKFKSDFDKWLITLSKLGYKNYWKVLNAKDYGIPQNRERVFCISISEKHTPYQFPNPIPLKLRLIDMLESNVDNKFYISNAMLNYIIADNKKWSGNNNKSLINKSIASTINTGEGSRRCDASNFICNTLDENIDLKKLIQIGSLINKPYDKMHESSKRVYLTIGISPTINTCGGGNLEPKIQLPIAYDEQNQYAKTDGVIGTLTTDGSSPKHNNRVIEPSYRVRKLTPKECWRLMGFTDEDFDRAKWYSKKESKEFLVNYKRKRKMYYDGKMERMSNNQLYKQAGNSIVVNVLEEVFKELIGN